MRATVEMPKSQSDKFKDAARDLGADESEEAFKRTLRKVGQHKPAESDPLDDANDTDETKKPGQ